MKIGHLIVSIAVLTAVGCTTIDTQGVPRTSSYESYTVELEPTATTLLVDSGPQGDDAVGKNNGWVGFKKGSYGQIEFVLLGDETKTTCTDNPTTSAEWVITKFSLSKFGKSSTQKGSSFGTNQTGWIRNAFPGINSKGILINEGTDTARTSVVLVNINNNNGKQTAYYEIEASRCDGAGDPIKTDPGIGNGGRK